MIDHDPYYCTLPNHRKELPKIVIGKPWMINPNLIDAARRVMEHFQDVNHLTDEHHERKWKFLQSDGVSYVYTRDIQDHMHERTECKEEVDSKCLLIDECNGFMKSHAEKRPSSSTKFAFNPIY